MFHRRRSEVLRCLSFTCHSFRNYRFHNKKKLFGSIHQSSYIPEQVNHLCIIYLWWSALSCTNTMLIQWPLRTHWCHYTAFSVPLSAPANVLGVHPPASSPKRETPNTPRMSAWLKSPIYLGLQAASEVSLMPHWWLVSECSSHHSHDIDNLTISQSKSMKVNERESISMVYRKTALVPVR